MNEIAIISGKGGTGKTTIVASLAQLMNIVIADCDVDAPNLKFILKPKDTKKEEYSGAKLAEINDKCIECYRCKEVCRFNAITEDLEVTKTKCEGCCTCKFVCPNDAISIKDRKTGEVITSNTRFGEMVYASLNIGEEASGKLVAKVKEKAREIAKEKEKETLLIDGSPGTGCPVIATIKGIDLALIVTEPTQSGIHDLKRVLKLTDHFNVKTVVCINKFDLNKNKSMEIIDFLEKKNIDVIGKLPFTKDATESMIQTKTVLEYTDSDLTKEIKNLAKEIKKKNTPENRK